VVEKPVTPFSSWRRWGTAGWLLFLIATAVGLFVGHVGGEQRGWVAGFLTGALVAAIRVSWPVRHELWFWATVAAFVSVDALAIAFVDWSFTEKWNGHTFAGLATLDVGAMLAIVYGLYRLNYGRPAEPIEEDPADLPDYADRDQDI
jgi:preprotein translocase subunit SecE